MMHKHQKVGQLVQDAYEGSSDEFAHWIWQNHVPVVAAKTEALCQRFSANAELAVAGAWLHDFGDAFVNRFAPEFEEVSRQKSLEVLRQAGYSDQELQLVLDGVIAPHTCKHGILPKSLEGKVMATGDALGHMMTDFYLQFAWKNLPEGKNYQQYRAWASAKIEHDFHVKIFFPEVRQEVLERYQALRSVFGEAKV